MIYSEESKKVSVNQVEAVVFVSGGLASWATAMLAAHKYKYVQYVFNDVLIEDQDCYRFLIEGISHVLHRPTPIDLMQRCLELPDIDSNINVRKRMWMLAEIRAEAMRRLPNFIWLADGRTPWMAWEDAEFIGNSRTAHCSEYLKVVHGDNWIKNNAPDAIAEYGLYFDELHRILKLEKRKPFKIGRMLYESGLTHGQIAAWAKRIGLRIGRSYSYGFSHDNCSGLCCKAGHKHWGEKYRRHPQQARYIADHEQRLLKIVKGGKTMLADRKGDGKKKPISLHKLFDSLDQQPSLFAELDDLGSSCECILAVPPEPIQGIN